ILVANKGRAELQTYQQALSGHTAGYTHLAAARSLAGHTLEVDPHFDHGLVLQGSVADESKKVDAALRNAESMIASQHYDDALAAVADFRSFTDEARRIAAIVDAAYKYPFEPGKADASSQKWHDAVQEYQKASDIKPTPESGTALKQAYAQFVSTTNRSAADAAIQQSAAYEQDKHY